MQSNSDQIVGKNVENSSKPIQHKTFHQSTPLHLYNEIAEQYQWKLQRAEDLISDRDVLIRLLKDQLGKMEHHYKKALDSSQSMRYKYCSTIQQLTTMKRLFQQILEENKQLVGKFNATRKVSKDAELFQSQMEKWKKEYKEILNKIEAMESNFEFQQLSLEGTSKSTPCIVFNKIRNIGDLIVGQNNALKFLVKKVVTSEPTDFNELPHTLNEQSIENLDDQEEYQLDIPTTFPTEAEKTETTRFSSTSEYFVENKKVNCRRIVEISKKNDVIENLKSPQGSLPKHLTEIQTFRLEVPKGQKPTNHKTPQRNEQSSNENHKGQNNHSCAAVPQKNRQSSNETHKHQCNSSRKPQPPPHAKHCTQRCCPPTQTNQMNPKQDPIIPEISEEAQKSKTSANKCKIPVPVSKKYAPTTHQTPARKPYDVLPEEPSMCVLLTKKTPDVLKTQNSKMVILEPSVCKSCTDLPSTSKISTATSKILINSPYVYPNYAKRPLVINNEDSDDGDRTQQTFSRYEKTFASVSVSAVNQYEHKATSVTSSSSCRSDSTRLSRVQKELSATNKAVNELREDIYDLRTYVSQKINDRNIGDGKDLMVYTSLMSELPIATTSYQTYHSMEQRPKPNDDESKSARMKQLSEIAQQVAIAEKDLSICKRRCEMENQLNNLSLETRKLAKTFDVISEGYNRDTQKLEGEIQNLSETRKTLLREQSKNNEAIEKFRKEAELSKQYFEEANARLEYMVMRVQQVEDISRESEEQFLREFKTMRKKNEELNEQIYIISKIHIEEIQVLEEEVDKLQVRCNELEAENTRNKNVISELNLRIEEAQIQNEKYLKQFADYSNLNEEKDKCMENITGSLNALQRSIDGNTKNYESCQKKCAEQLAFYKEMLAANKRKLEEMETLKSDMNGLKEEIALLSAENEKLRQGDGVFQAKSTSKYSCNDEHYCERKCSHWSEENEHPNTQKLESIEVNQSVSEILRDSSVAIKHCESQINNLKQELQTVQQESKRVEANNKSLENQVHKIEQLLQDRALHLPKIASADDVNAQPSEPVDFVPITQEKITYEELVPVVEQPVDLIKQGTYRTEAELALTKSTESIRLGSIRTSPRVIDDIKEEEEPLSSDSFEGMHFCKIEIERLRRIQEELSKLRKAISEENHNNVVVVQLAVSGDEGELMRSISVIDEELQKFWDDLMTYDRGILEGEEDAGFDSDDELNTVIKLKRIYEALENEEIPNHVLLEKCKRLLNKLDQM